MKIIFSKMVKSILAIVLASAIILCYTPQSVIAYDGIFTWKTRYDNKLAEVDTAEYKYGYSDTADSADLCWGGAYMLDSLHRMYILTKDIGYIAKMSTYIHNMNSHRAYKGGWGTIRYGNTYREYLVHYGHIIYQWAKFILTVRADNTLSSSTNPQGVTYASQAGSMENVINDYLIPRFDSAWSNKYQVYEDHNNPDHSLPHNQYAAMAGALYLMGQVTPEKKHYILWADLLTSKWIANLSTSGSAYIWNYWDRLFPADSHTVRKEDFSHAIISLFYPIQNYNRGGTLSQTSEMAKFGSTIYDKLWDGSSTDPKMYHYVDRTGPVDGKFLMTHGDFERWKSGIWTLYEKAHSLRWDTENSIFSLFGASSILALHPSRGAPQSFTLSKPLNSAAAQNTDLAFQWTPSVNAADYTLQVSTNSSFSTYTVYRNKIIGTSAYVTGLANSTTYYWRIVARNATGLTSTSSTYSFTTKAAPTYTLSFWHRDTASGSTAGYHFKQVLIDDVVVWEQDVATDQKNTWLVQSVNITPHCAGKSHVHIKLRLYEKKGVHNYGINTYWDDMTLTASDVQNGDFEKNQLWYYTESGAKFSGVYNISTVHGGERAYRISYPSYTRSYPGYYGAIEQQWALKR